MAARLDIDAHVLAYLGFDEANETDVALDESSYVRDFTVVTSPSVIVARVNNGRQFNGTVTYAYPADSAPFRLTEDLTIIVWISLDQVSSQGSFLRAILECAGSGAGSDSNCLYGLYFSSTGELVYRHQNGTKQDVILKTAAGTIRTGRYYSVAVRRVAVTADTCQLVLYIDNRPVSWAGSDGIVAKPTDGAAADLVVGKSVQHVDGAFWYGVLDELSIHDIARPYQPYLRSVYFTLTLYSVFFRVTAYNNVKSVGTAEMGGGERWWVYERDQSLYAIRENTLGLFSPEVQLTTTGIQVNGTIGPGGSEKPTVVYDKTNDTLIVAFISAGKVYRFTASSGDAPITQQLPITVDTSTIIKVREANEGIRLGVGSSSNKEIGPWLQLTTRGVLKQGASDSIALGTGGDSGAEALLKDADIMNSSLHEGVGVPSIQFTGWPSFGIFIPSLSTYGVAVYSRYWGLEQLEGYIYAGQAITDELGRTFGFWPVTTRRSGTFYFIRILDSNRRPRANASNAIIDLLATAEFASAMNRVNNVMTLNRDGDLPQLAPLGTGVGNKEVPPWLSFVTRTPLKMGTADSVSLGAGGGLQCSVTCTPSPAAPKRLPVEVA